MNEMYLTIPNGFIKDNNGAYKWYGVYNFYTNPEGLILTTKVVFITMAILIVFLWLLIPTLETVIVISLVGLMILYISLISYYILAVLQGGKAFYLYTMNENGIIGKPAKRTKDTAKAIGTIALIIGVLARSPRTSGSGALILASQDVYIDFSRIKKMTVKRNRNLICVKYKLKIHHIYVVPHQIDFVANYINSNISNRRGHK